MQRRKRVASSRLLQQFSIVIYFFCYVRAQLGASAEAAASKPEVGHGCLKIPKLEVPDGNNAL